MRVTLSLLIAATFASTFFVSAAHADEKAECVRAYEQTQQLRTQNKLRAAREQLLVCTRDACPKLVRTDCAKWMDEVTAGLPSIVFAARDARGGDRADVRVILDGEAVSGKLGQEVVVDPGVHKLRFEAAGAEPVDQEIVVAVGEKARTITVTLRDVVADAPPPAPPPNVVTPPLEEEKRPIPLLVPVLGGLGVVALGGATYLAFSTSSQLDDLRSKCAPHCEQSDVDTLNMRYRVAAVAAGVGVIAVGAAIWMFVTRPTASEKRGATLDVGPSGVTVYGRF